MIEATDSYLAHMGWSGHQAVYVAHNDTAHTHVHIILNRVNPDTGRTLDDFREQIRSQVWALAYVREHGWIYCETRLDKDYAADNIPKRDDQFPNGVEKEGRLQEQPFIDASAKLAKLDGTERDLLHDRQREEREAFFASAGSEFRTARQHAFVDVRREFRAQWKEHYADSRMLMLQARELQQADAATALKMAGEGKFGEAWQQIVGGETPETFNPMMLAKMSIAASRERIAEAQKLERVSRQQSACEQVFGERADRYADMKERQRDERAELRDMGAAASRGETVDRDRLVALLYGDRGPKPSSATDPNALLASLRQANDNAQAIDQKPEANDNRPPHVGQRQAEIARANHHIDLLLASTRMTNNASMASMQMADMKRLQKQEARSRREGGDGEASDRLQRIMALDERTDAERQRDLDRAQPRRRRAGQP